MKICLTLVALLLASISWAEDTQPKTCEQCPPSSPCGYTTKSDCNTCSGVAFCVDGRWYSLGVTACTTMYCGGAMPMLNPFEPKGEPPR